MNQSSDEKNIGFLTSLRSQATKPKPFILSSTNIFQFTKFGFLQWNAQSNQFDLTAVLKEESEICEQDGNLARPDLTFSKKYDDLRLMISDKKQKERRCTFPPFHGVFKLPDNITLREIRERLCPGI